MRLRERPMDIKIGIVCDRGLNPKRPVNQDSYVSMPDKGLFAVFDGVGGQRAGEIASGLASETIEEFFTREAPSPELIARAITRANTDIFEMAEGDPNFKTMASTIALVHVSNNKATI